MKLKNQLITFLLSFLFSTTSVFASMAEEMPVLKVYFPGNQLIYEDYTFGRMKLTDTDGSVVELPAKFKTRGATAREFPMKPSFNMKLEEENGEEIDYDLLGLRKASSFILDAMAIDRICMRNRVCFDIWNQYSRLPYKTDFDSRNGTVGKFVIVYMNDEYKGIYCLTDKINRKLLDLKKPKVDGEDVVYGGVLYKQGTTDVGDQNTPGFFNDYMVYVARWHDAWELKEPDAYPSEEAWQPLVDYYDHYGEISYIEDNFYEENLADYTLLIMALCIQDNWGLKNKYFSIRNITEADEDRFIVTPWDLDTSLGGHYRGDYYDGNYANWTMKQIAGSAIPPFSVCFTTEAGRNLLRQRWIDTRQTAFSVENVSSLMYGYCDLFASSGAWKQQVDYWDARSNRPKYVSDLRKEVDLIVEWYAKRFEEMDDYFAVSDAGVEVIDNENHNLGDYIIYNLQGIRVSPEMVQPGRIYIINGKKVIMR